MNSKMHTVRLMITHNIKLTRQHVNQVSFLLIHDRMQIEMIKKKHLEEQFNHISCIDLITTDRKPLWGRFLEV